MIILGIILLVAGFLFKFSVLWAVGLVLRGCPEFRGTSAAAR